MDERRAVARARGCVALAIALPLLSCRVPEARPAAGKVRAPTGEDLDEARRLCLELLEVQGKLHRLEARLVALEREGAPSRSASAREARPKPRPEEARALRVEGRLEHLDEGWVRIRPRDRPPYALRRVAGTAFLYEGRRVRPGSIPTGVRVRAVVEEKRDAWTAREVKVLGH